MKKIAVFIKENERQILKRWEKKVTLTCPRLTCEPGEDNLVCLLANILSNLEGLAEKTKQTDSPDYSGLFVLAESCWRMKLTAGCLLAIFRHLRSTINDLLFEQANQESLDEGFLDNFLSRLMEAMAQVKESNFRCQQKELKILRELNQIMREGISTEEIMSSISSVLTCNIKAKALIMLVDRTGLELRAAASSGLQNSSFKTLRLKVNQGIIGKSVNDKVILLANRVEKDQRICYPELLLAERVGCLLSIPLYNKEKVIGALVFMTEKEKDLKKEGIGFLTSIADHIGLALEKSILYKDIYENYLFTIKALVAAIDAKDNYTRGHSERVMEYAVIISKTLGLPETVIDDIKFAALLHDIGKIGIDENILRKPGRLTEEEFTTISNHPRIGAKILNQVDYLRNLIPAILYHHERFGGDGYPNGIAGINIPLAARILAVADSLDAMTYDRPYRRAFSIEEALNELVRCSGTQFDPQVVAALFKSVGMEIPKEFLFEQAEYNN